ncbi:MAG TPA: alternative ribosome rescue aminoacyl-tRNA hydrolase ArfB [Promineifilum sp.]|nr:alternative ribosome rescue aminoacyl-tRNA hydrolase ArfB [Promineifilum sp.]
METDLIPITEALSLPLAELVFRFTTGGGPGGQHVNKTATRVTLLFDVARTPSLDEATRARLLDRLANRLDRRGVLHIDVQDSRSQWQNRELAIARLQSLLAGALAEQAERRPTRPSRRARQARLDDKRRHSTVKRERQQRWED